MSIKDLVTIEELCNAYPKIVTMRRMRKWLVIAKKDPNFNWGRKLGKLWLIDEAKFFDWLEKLN